MNVRPIVESDADAVASIVVQDSEALTGRPALGLPAGAIPGQRGAGDDIIEAIDGHPDQVAGLLRGWMASSGTGS